MATHDYIIANASGAAVRADLNNALAAIVSNNSNATAPATTYAYQWWADTTANQLKLRNSTNTDWIVIQELDGTMLMEDGTAAAPGLAFADELDTGLFRPAANQLGVATNGVERVEFGTTEVVFNDSGANVDFRVEGDSEANLLFVDAGNDHVGIAESAPGTVLEIGSTEPYVTLKNSTEEDTDGGRESRLIFEGEQSGGEISTLAQIEVSHDGTADDEKGKVVISTNDGSDGASPTAALTISADQTVAVADNLTVNGNQYPNVGPLSNRNMFENGAMRVTQRGSSKTGMSSAVNNLNVDRMKFAVSGLGTWTSTSETAGPAGFVRSLKLNCTTADASPAAADYAMVRVNLEAVDLQPLAYGTADAKAITISFYVKSNKTGDGTFEILQMDNTSKHYTTTYNISAADTWERKTITIPGDTAGQIDDDTGVGFALNWWFNSGSDYTSGAVSNAWQALDQTDRNTSNLGVGGAVNDNWSITGLQIEIGEKATPFEHRNYQDYLAACQRYFIRLPGSLYSQVYSSSNSMISYDFPVHMRDEPTVTGSYGTGGTLSTNYTKYWRFQRKINNDTTVTLSNAEFSAEL